MTPFGVPVLPDVNTMYNTSDGLTPVLKGGSDGTSVEQHRPGSTTNV